MTVPLTNNVHSKFHNNSSYQYEIANFQIWENIKIMSFEINTKISLILTGWNDASIMIKECLKSENPCLLWQKQNHQNSRLNPTFVLQKKRPLNRPTYHFAGTRSIWVKRQVLGGSTNDQDRQLSQLESMNSYTCCILRKYTLNLANSQNTEIHVQHNATNSSIQSLNRIQAQFKMRTPNSRLIPGLSNKL